MRAACGFFGLAFALTWGCELPYLWARAGHPLPPALVLLPMAVGALGPALAALALTPRGERARLCDLAPPRWAPWSWWALALPSLVALAAGAAYAVGGGAPAWLAPQVTGPGVGIALLSPLGEELGWRRYALPRLAARLSPLGASVVVAVAWCLWHLPYDGVPGAADYAWFVAMSIVFTWLYGASGGNLRVAVLAHLGIHVAKLAGVATGTPRGYGIAAWIALALLLVLARGPRLGWRIPPMALGPA